MRSALFSRHIGFRVFPVIFLVCSARSALSAEVVWTGAVDNWWENTLNWEGGVPDPDDVAVIPDTSRSPRISSAVTLCAGVVLGEGATIEFGTGCHGLYIVGEGDLDGDGVSDRAEIAFGDPEGGGPPENYDADGDQIPNFAETDSDNDGASDACEFAYYPKLNPYNAEGPDADYDGDTYSNAVECEAGSDPTVWEDVPVAIPLAGVFGLGLLGLLLAGTGFVALRRMRPRARRVLLLLMAVALLPLGFYAGARHVLAVSLVVDFAQGQTLEGVVDGASPADELVINGASSRPWNGRSTYVHRPVALVRAVGGPVFLGGMRCVVHAGVLGEGALTVQSAYAEPDHPLPVSAAVPAGSAAVPVFLGERITLTPQPEPGWGFHGWTDAAGGDDAPLTFPVTADGLRVTAMFGPPGPDLAARVTVGPSAVLFAGADVDVTFQVENIGQSETVEAAWDDGLYLSRDAVFDAADLKLAETGHSGAVAAGDAYTVSFPLPLPAPDVAPGRYHLLCVADTGRDATDENLGNNTAAVGISVHDAHLAK